MGEHTRLRIRANQQIPGRSLALQEAVIEPAAVLGPLTEPEFRAFLPKLVDFAQTLEHHELMFLFGLLARATTADDPQLPHDDAYADLCARLAFTAWRVTVEPAPLLPNPVPSATPPHGELS